MAASFLFPGIGNKNILILEFFGKKNCTVRRFIEERFERARERKGEGQRKRKRERMLV